MSSARYSRNSGFYAPASAVEIHESPWPERPFPSRDRSDEPLVLDHVNVYEYGHPVHRPGSPTPSVRSTAARSRFLGNATFLRWVGCALHIILIAAHVVLLLLKHFAVEGRVLLPLGKTTDRITVLIPVVSQAVWVLYLAGLLLVTQQLALHRVLTTRQLLTATHDKLAAWNGMGASLLGLMRQFSAAASFSGVLTITVYLTAAHIVHITAPALLTFVAAEANVATYVSEKVTYGLPLISPFVPETPAAAAMAGAGLLPVLSKSQILSTPGLQGNLLYDVPVSEGAAGELEVNVTSVDVKCGTVPGAKQLGQKETYSWTIGANHAGKYFMFDLGRNSSDVNHYIDANTLTMGLSLYDNPSHSFNNLSETYWPGSGSSIRPVDFTFPTAGSDDVAMPFYGANMVFWSYANVSDGSGSNGSYVALSPGVPIPWTYYNSPTYGLGVQVIGCTLQTTTKMGTLNMNTSIVSSPFQSNWSTKWDTWQPTFYDDNKPNFGRPTLEETLGMMITGPSLRDKAAIPEYLAGHANLQLTVYQTSYSAAQGSGQVRLQDFEAALENATAAVLWTAARIGGLDTNQLFYLQQGTSTNKLAQPALRLNINTLPLIVGLVASCILFVLFWILIGPTSDGGNMVDGAGMLQILWLFGGSQEQERVAALPEEKASLDSLREAGMFLALPAGASKVVGGGLLRRTTLKDASTPPVRERGHSLLQ